MLAVIRKYGEAAATPERWVTTQSGKKIPISRPTGRQQAAQPAAPTGQKVRLRMTATGPAGMHSAADEERKTLKVPPAYTNVFIADDLNDRLLMVGRDSKGRTVRRYNAEFLGENAAAKFSRVKDFSKAVPSLLDTIDLDAEKSEEAAVLYLIAKTGFRVGSDSDTGADKQAYGASTLKPEHCTVVGSTVRFSFIGKKGVRIQKTITDQKLAGIIGGRMNAKRLFTTTPDAVNGYLQGLDSRFTVKDFRTWHGTKRALTAIKNMPVPKDAKAYKKARAKIGDLVAGHLGNTRAVALSSYIDPSVFAVWDKAVPA